MASAFIPAALGLASTFAPQILSAGKSAAKAFLPDALNFAKKVVSGAVGGGLQKLVGGSGVKDIIRGALGGGRSAIHQGQEALSQSAINNANRALQDVGSMLAQRVDLTQPNSANALVAGGGGLD